MNILKVILSIVCVGLMNLTTSAFSLQNASLTPHINYCPDSIYGLKIKKTFDCSDLKGCHVANIHFSIPENKPITIYPLCTYEEFGDLASARTRFKFNEEDLNTLRILKQYEFYLKSRPYFDNLERSDQEKINEFYTMLSQVPRSSKMVGERFRKMLFKADYIYLKLKQALELQNQNPENKARELAIFLWNMNFVNFNTRFLNKTHEMMKIMVTVVPKEKELMLNTFMKLNGIDMNTLLFYCQVIEKEFCETAIKGVSIERVQKGYVTKHGKLNDDTDVVEFYNMDDVEPTEVCNTNECIKKDLVKLAKTTTQCISGFNFDNKVKTISLSEFARDVEKSMIERERKCYQNCLLLLTCKNYCTNKFITKVSMYLASITNQKNSIEALQIEENNFQKQQPNSKACKAININTLNKNESNSTLSPEIFSTTLKPIQTTPKTLAIAKSNPQILGNCSNSNLFWTNKTDNVYCTDKIGGNIYNILIQNTIIVKFNYNYNQPQYDKIDNIDLNINRYCEKNKATATFCEPVSQQHISINKRDLDNNRGVYNIEVKNLYESENFIEANMSTTTPTTLTTTTTTTTTTTEKSIQSAKTTTEIIEGSGDESPTTENSKDIEGSGDYDDDVWSTTEVSTDSPNTIEITTTEDPSVNEINYDMKGPMIKQFSELYQDPDVVHIKVSDAVFNATEIKEQLANMKGQVNISNIVKYDILSPIIDKVRHVKLNESKRCLKNWTPLTNLRQEPLRICGEHFRQHPGFNVVSIPDGKMSVNQTICRYALSHLLETNYIKIALLKSDEFMMMNNDMTSILDVFEYVLIVLNKLTGIQFDIVDSKYAIENGHDINLLVSLMKFNDDRMNGFFHLSGVMLIDPFELTVPKLYNLFMHEMMHVLGNLQNTNNPIFFNNYFFFFFTFRIPPLQWTQIDN